MKYYERLYNFNKEHMSDAGGNTIYRSYSYILNGINSILEDMRKDGIHYRTSAWYANETEGVIVLSYADNVIYIFPFKED